MPGPGYVWIDGFNGPTGFVAGYWALPPAAGAFWVAPTFVGGRFDAAQSSIKILPDGVILASLANLLKTQPGLVEPLLGKLDEIAKTHEAATFAGLERADLEKLDSMLDHIANNLAEL